MAFADIYKDFFAAVLKTLLHEHASADMALLPSMEDGLSTLRLIEAAVASNDSGHTTKLLPAVFTASHRKGDLL